MQRRLGFNLECIFVCKKMI